MIACFMFVILSDPERTKRVEGESKEPDELVPPQPYGPFCQ